LSENNQIAMNIWYLMGKVIDWAALELLFEYFEVDDSELVLDALLYIRQRSG